MAKIIAIVNQKGGVGKTTTTVNLTAALAALGKRVLLCDFDPQANATSGMGVDKNTASPNVYDVLINGADPRRGVVTTHYGDVLPSNKALAGAGVEMIALPDREHLLRKALEVLSPGYDFIFVDCPPSLELLTVNALCAADSLLVPVQCEYYALEGLSDLLSTVRQMRGKVTKKYRDQLDGKHQWLIVAAPSPAWARKVFPGEPEDIAVEKLWNAIFDCLYLKEGEDVEKIWQAHCDRMTQKANWLNEQAFRKLHYTSKNGTDFTVELIPDAKWSGAGDINHMNNTFYVPNMPTEEVFTSPMRGKCEGRLVSTKPLSWSGQVINNFTVDFKDGKVVDCHAEQGEEVLKKMFAMDEGAAMLGEVALVPKESPINQSGLMFFNTLFDENACCHVAAGAGFSEVLDGFMDMSDEEILAKGINDSLIHVDFMVGSDDLHIVGIHEDGSETDVFVNGTWAE